MGYELRTNVVDPERNTFSYLVERFGDRPATRYQEASFNIQPKENFHYRPTWDPDHEIYDPDYSALKLTDPYSYTDPRQYYYTPYVANAADRYESFAQTLKYIEDRRLLDKLPEAWHTVLTGFVLPLRHYEQGAQLILTNANRFGYGTTVTQAAGFAAFDRIGNAQQLSLIGLTLAGGAADTLGEAKKNWLYAPQLQGLRRMIEELLVERDWAVGLVGLDLLDQSLYPLLYEHLDERALFRGAGPYSLLAQPFPQLVRRAPQVAQRPVQGVDRRPRPRRGEPRGARRDRRPLVPALLRGRPDLRREGSPSSPARAASWAPPSGASRSWPRR